MIFRVTYFARKLTVSVSIGALSTSNEVSDVLSVLSSVVTTGFVVASNSGSSPVVAWPSANRLGSSSATTSNSKGSIPDELGEMSNDTTVGRVTTWEIVVLDLIVPSEHSTIGSVGSGKTRAIRSPLPLFVEVLSPPFGALNIGVSELLASGERLSPLVSKDFEFTVITNFGSRVASSILVMESNDVVFEIRIFSAASLSGISSAGSEDSLALSIVGRDGEVSGDGDSSLGLSVDGRGSLDEGVSVLGGISSIVFFVCGLFRLVRSDLGSVGSGGVGSRSVFGVLDKTLDSVLVES
jgi:hypothetical protein